MVEMSAKRVLYKCQIGNWIFDTQSWESSAVTIIYRIDK